MGQASRELGNNHSRPRGPFIPVQGSTVGHERAVKPTKRLSILDPTIATARKPSLRGTQQPRSPERPVTSRGANRKLATAWALRRRDVSGEDGDEKVAESIRIRRTEQLQGYFAAPASRETTRARHSASQDRHPAPLCGPTPRPFHPERVRGECSGGAQAVDTVRPASTSLRT